MASAGDVSRKLISSGVSQTGGLSQTGIMFTCMIIGFLVYVTCKGQLPAYISLFVGQQPSNTGQ